MAVGSYTDTSNSIHGLIDTLNGGTWTATAMPVSGLNPLAGGTWSAGTAPLSGLNPPPKR